MDRIQEAFEAVSRSDYLPTEAKDYAEIDSPLQIGFGQTNSQPSTVRMMLEWLDPQLGDKVLDVGSGSGWTSALLGWLVRPKGQVYAVEIIPDLLAFGSENCRQSGIRNVTFYQAGQTFGLPTHAPYDKILVSAAAKSIPAELVKQLKASGTMVIPVGDAICVIYKNPDGTLSIAEHPGFAFVPLVNN